MLRLGVVGCGRVTTMFHLWAIKEVGEVELVAVVDRHKSSMESVKGACRAYKGYVDYQELLSDPEVDAVVVNTPPKLHEEMVIQALRAGKHVMCEKPLATSSEGGLRIKRAQEGTGLVVLPVHNYVFTPSLERATELIQDGDLGGIQKVSIRFENNLKSYGSKTDFRLEKEYGIVEDILPHILSVTHVLAGAAKTIEDVRGWRKSYGVIDNMILDLKTWGGATLDCHLSWTRLVPAFKLGITCSSGRIEADLIRSPFSVTVESGGAQRRVGERKGLGLYVNLLRLRHPSFPRQYEHLCRLVDGSEKPRITIDDEIAMISMIEEVVKCLSQTDKPGAH